MAKQQQKYSFEVQGSLSGGETLVPLSQATRIAELLSKMPIEIVDAGSCRIEVNDSRVDIYGLDRGLSQCRVINSSQVIGISVNSERIEFELKGGDFHNIAVHFKKKTARSTEASTSYGSSLPSSGESRGGYGGRASG